MRRGLAVASILVLGAIAIAAPAAEKRRVQLGTPGTAEDVAFRPGGPVGSRLFSTTESLVKADDDGGQPDLYMRTHGRTSLLSKPTGVPDPGTPVKWVGESGDLKRVLFTTAGRYTTDDQDSGRVDIYERSRGVTRLVSKSSPSVPDPDTGDVDLVAFPPGPEFSKVFFSTTQRMTPDDTDGGAEDVYLRDDTYGITVLVTRTDGGEDTTDSDSSSMSMSPSGISRDGELAYFTTSASLDPGDADGGRSDVYVREVHAADTRLVSRPEAAGPDVAAFDAQFAGIGFDGLRAFFETSEPMTATDMDGMGSDGFVRANGHTGLVTTGPSDPQTGDAEIDDLSFDGRTVLFRTAAKMTPDDGDSNRVDSYFRAHGMTELATGPTGVPAPDAVNVGPSELSLDGELVLFETTEKLGTKDRDGGQTDLYTHFDGRTTQVTVATGVPDPKLPDDIDLSESAVAPRGSNVFFVTGKRLTADDHDSGRRDVYMRDDGGTTLISKASGVPQPDTGDASIEPGKNAYPDRFYFITRERLGPGDTDGGATDAYFSNLFPTVSNVRIEPEAFRAKDGTLIRFGVSERASVTIAFRRKGKGRILGRRTFPAFIGISSRRFDGGLPNGRKLKPGRYTARVVARDTDGARSPFVQRNFRILAPK